MSKKSITESRVLRLSIWGLIIFSIIGIVLGLAFTSYVILFDGFFALFSTIISYITLKISQFIHKKDRFNFPFGKSTLEPVIVLIQYLVLGLILFYTLTSTFHILLTGGNQAVNILAIIIYLLISINIMHFIVTKMKKLASKTKSPLIEAEIFQWQVSITQSYYALAGYIIAYILILLSFHQFIPYIDPLLVLIFVILTLFSVVKEIITAFKEIIGMRSISKKLHREIEAKIETIVAQYGIEDHYVRVNKMGSTIFIEIDFLVARDFKFGSIRQQDQIREKIENLLDITDYELWLTIGFTTRRKWLN